MRLKCFKRIFPVTDRGLSETNICKLRSSVYQLYVYSYCPNSKIEQKNNSMRNLYCEQLWFTKRISSFYSSLSYLSLCMLYTIIYYIYLIWQSHFQSQSYKCYFMEYILYKYLVPCTMVVVGSLSHHRIYIYIYSHHK